MTILIRFSKYLGFNTFIVTKKILCIVLVYLNIKANKTTHIQDSFITLLEKYSRKLLFHSKANTSFSILKFHNHKPKYLTNNLKF